MRIPEGIVKLLLLGCCVGTIYGCAIVPGANTELTPSPARQQYIPLDAVKMTPELDMFPPVMHASEWSQPVPVKGLLNTAGAEDSAYVLPDGNTMYFFFTPDVNVPPEQQVLDGVTGIYKASRVDNEWQNVQRVILQEAGKLALDGCAAVQQDIMWFCSAREGFTGVNIFTAETVDGIWQNWKYAGDMLNQEYEMGEVHVSADGQILYFHSLRAGGQGKIDIWVTWWIDNKWRTPENLRAVNSPEDEGWPFVTHDGRELWFTRTYQGSPAVYRSVMTDGHWAEPELIISQFAGEPSVDNAGNIYFTHHYFIDGQMVEADIYVAYRQ